MSETIPYNDPLSTANEIDDLREQVVELRTKLRNARTEIKGLKEGLRSVKQPAQYHEPDPDFLSSLQAIGIIEPTTCYVCGLPGYWIRRVADGKFRFLLRSGARHTHTVFEFAAADKRENRDNSQRKQALLRLDRTKRWRP